MSNLMQGLNDQQIESVITTTVPLRIIAGAGSGKTKAITTKIAYLIEQEQVKPWKILAVTFTNKAANEMKNRVTQLTGATDIKHIMTFHAFCVRVLREEFAHAGLTINFQIIDTDDQVRIVREQLKAINEYDPKVKDEKKILARISAWKAKFYTWEDAEKDSVTATDKRYAKVYRRYIKHLSENDKVDFDDLILKVHAIFESNIEVRKKWQNRFDYVLVDEFQDTNYAQFDLIKWIVGERNCLTVVGDPDQNIYSWRGAKLKIILEFEKNFKNAQTILLTQNYRSTKNILDLANKFIDNNKDRVKKDIFTENVAGELTHIKEANSKNFEAKFVAKEITRLVSEHNYQYSDFYVLYRTNAWSLEFENEFTKANIPFSLVGAFRFIDRKEIKDVLALLKIVVLKEKSAFERVFKFIPKVGDVTAQRIYDAAALQEISIFDFLTKHLDEVYAITKNLQDLCATLIEAEKMVNNDEKLLTLVQYLFEKSGLKTKLATKSNENTEAMQNIEIFLDQLSQFDEEYEQQPQEISRTHKLLQEMSLVSGAVDEADVLNRVTLMTIHAAKGLENKVVFIVGLNQDVFPSRMSLSAISALEEERRAFYVAITRAQELLYISYVVGEYSYISSGELGPSRFISELDPSLYKIEKNIFFHPGGVKTSQKFDSGIMPEKVVKLDSGVEVGDFIEHMMFGKGVVDSILDRYIKVIFENKSYGVKSIPINSSVWSKIS